MSNPTDPSEAPTLTMSAEETTAMWGDGSKFKSIRFPMNLWQVLKFVHHVEKKEEYRDSNFETFLRLMLSDAAKAYCEQRDAKHGLEPGTSFNEACYFQPPTKDK